MAEYGAERWRQIDEIFAAALERSPEERADFVASACGDDAELRERVEDLLGASEQAGEFLEAPVVSLPPDLWAAVPEPANLAGKRVGRYRIVRELARGGMGTVYLAERADGAFEQRVALKLLRRGLDTDDILARFRAERQILASLSHPNIARLVDGGATEDGRPYLAMEFVEGEPIDRYCDRERLTVEQRLSLFAAVARAVEHAHRNLVVHRDLKPSNILVAADGTPKLLDFGIAKLLDPASDVETPATRTGVRLLTPDYASPEQLRGGPVTTATDVYQLGLLLYQLLTGGRPRGALDRRAPSPAAVLDRDPTRPSAAVARGAAHPSTVGAEGAVAEVARARRTDPARLRRKLRGELDAIVLTALAGEPERRYGSVGNLADDIVSYLAGRPVAARGDTPGYRLRKFVRRHRAGVMAASLVVLLSGGYMVSLVRYAEELEREREVARLEAAKSQEVSDFLVGLFGEAEPANAQGREVTVRDVLERGEEQIEAELAGEPGVQAAMLDAVGRAYRSLGRLDEAERPLRKALALRRSLHAARPHAELAQSLNSVGMLLRDQGDYEAAEPLLRESIAIHRQLVGEDRRALLANELKDLSYVLRQRGDLDGSAAAIREALQMQRDLYGGAHMDVAESLFNLAAILRERGRYDEAERVQRESLTIARELADGELHPGVVANLGNLALLLRKRGRDGEAEALYREALPMNRALYGESHPEVATSLDNLADVLKERGDLSGADSLYRRALDIRRHVHGERHPRIAGLLSEMALVQMNGGDLDAAERLVRRALAMQRELLGDDHRSIGTTLTNLGTILFRKGEHRAAEATLRDALARQRSSYGAEHARTSAALLALGGVVAQRSRPEAEPLLREAVRVRRAVFAEGHWEIAEAESLLGANLAAQGRLAEAEPLLRGSYGVLQRLRGPEDPHTLRARERLVSLGEIRRPSGEAAREGSRSAPG